MSLSNFSLAAEIIELGMVATFCTVYGDSNCYSGYNIDGGYYSYCYNDERYCVSTPRALSFYLRCNVFFCRI